MRETVTRMPLPTGQRLWINPIQGSVTRPHFRKTTLIVGLVLGAFAIGGATLGLAVSRWQVSSSEGPFVSQKIPSLQVPAQQISQAMPDVAQALSGQPIPANASNAAVAAPPLPVVTSPASATVPPITAQSPVDDAARPQEKISADVPAVFEPPRTQPPQSPKVETAVPAQPPVVVLPAPLPTGDPRVQSAIVLIQRARTAKDAVAAYNQVESVAKGDSQLNRTFIGKALQLGMPQMAFNAAEMYAQTDRRDPLGWSVTGYCRARLGQFASAVTALAQAMALDDADVSTQRNLGQLLAWYDAKGTAATVPQVIRQLIDDRRAGWMRIDEFRQSYNKLAVTYRDRSAAREDLRKQIAQAQAKLDALKDQADSSLSRYNWLIGEIQFLNQHTPSPYSVHRTIFHYETTDDLRKEADQVRQELQALAVAVTAARDEIERLTSQMANNADPQPSQWVSPASHDADAATKGASGPSAVQEAALSPDLMPADRL